MQGGFLPYDEGMAAMMTSGGPITAEALIVSGETDDLVRILRAHPSVAGLEPTR
jgi:hypothetical protein